MKDNISIRMMIGIVIVVAIVTSFVTTSFTGKAILSNTADSVTPMTVKSSNWLQAIFKGTASAGGIGLNSFDNKQFEIQSVQAGGIPGTTKNGLIIYDRTAGAYRQVITSDGNVGIGTTNPTAKLDVNGDIKANNIYTKAEIDAKLNTLSSNIPESYILRGNNIKFDSYGVRVADIEYRKDGVWTIIKTNARVGDVIIIGNAQFRIDYISDERGSVEYVQISGIGSTLLENTNESAYYNTGDGNPLIAMWN